MIVKYFEIDLKRTHLFTYLFIFKCLSRFDSNELQTIQESQRQKTEAAEVKPYGGQGKKETYFQIKIPWLENSRPCAPIAKLRVRLDDETERYS